MAGRKICNNNVVFMADGKVLEMFLSDLELKKLRLYSVRDKGEDCERMKIGVIRNFSLCALLDYEWKSRYKAAKINKAFPYREHSNVYWCLETAS